MNTEAGVDSGSARLGNIALQTPPSAPELPTVDNSDISTTISILSARDGIGDISLDNVPSESAPSLNQLASIIRTEQEVLAPGQLHPLQLLELLNHAVEKNVTISSSLGNTPAEIVRNYSIRALLSLSQESESPVQALIWQGKNGDGPKTALQVEDPRRLAQSFDPSKGHIAWIDVDNTALAKNTDAERIKSLLALALNGNGAEHGLNPRVLAMETDAADARRIATGTKNGLVQVQDIQTGESNQLLQLTPVRVINGNNIVVSIRGDNTSAPMKIMGQMKAGAPFDISDSACLALTVVDTVLDQVDSFVGQKDKELTEFFSRGLERSNQKLSAEEIAILQSDLEIHKQALRVIGLWTRETIRMINRIGEDYTLTPDNQKREDYVSSYRNFHRGVSQVVQAMESTITDIEKCLDLQRQTARDSEQKVQNAIQAEKNRLEGMAGMVRAQYKDLAVAGAAFLGVEKISGALSAGDWYTAGALIAVGVVVAALWTRMRIKVAPIEKRLMQSEESRSTE